jgi:hypothetical protein
MIKKIKTLIKPLVDRGKPAAQNRTAGISSLAK